MSLILTPAARAETYAIASNETLSNIAHRKIGPPVYGKRGSLQLLLSWNPHIANPDLIRPGMKIHLRASGQTGTLAHSPAAASPSDDKTNTMRKNREPAQIQTPSPTPAPHVPRPAVILIPPSESETTPPTLSARPASSNRETEPTHQLQLGLGYLFTSLQGTSRTDGTQALLNSSHHLRFSAVWEQQWTSSTSTFAAFEISHLDFADTSDGNRELTGTAKTPAQLHFGFNHRFNSRLRLQTDLGYGHELFVRARTAQTFTVDALSVPSLHADLQFTFLKGGTTSMGAGLEATTLGPASSDSEATSVEAGTGFGFYAFLRKESRIPQKGGLLLKLGYQERSQNTALVEGTQADVSGTLFYLMPLFEESQP